VDRIVDDTEKKLFIPENAAMINGIYQFSNVPPDILRAIQDVIPQEEEEASDPLFNEEDEREAQSLRERINQILRKEEENA
jgi:hypothetical protein